MGCHPGVLIECTDSCPPFTFYPNADIHGISHGALDSLDCQWPEPASSSASPQPRGQDVKDNDAQRPSCTPCLEGADVGIDEAQALVDQILGLADTELDRPSLGLTCLDGVMQPPLDHWDASVILAL